MNSSNLTLYFLGLCILWSFVSVSLAFCFSTGMNAIARNPSKSEEIQTLTYVGAAFIEFLVFLGAMLYFMLYFFK